MPTFRIHRIKDAPGESFRWAAHTGGLAIVKPKDYELDGEADAPTPYAAWKLLVENGGAIRPGDLLELLEPAGGSQLYIFKYIGFEPAHWYVPESAPLPSHGTESAVTSISTPP